MTGTGAQPGNGGGGENGDVILELDDIRVKYGGIEALKGISLKVRTGEVVALIGANGAGKTTTLRAISGMVKPTTGTVRFKGQDLADTPMDRIVRMGISHAPEGRGIFPNLSVEENLRLGGYTRLPGEIEEGIRRAFQLFPILQERRMQSAGTLSGGEQQMLTISRALVARPSLVLLDEPSLGLAPQIINLIFRIIVEINSQGTSILLVEQNAHQALGISHRGYVLETGRIVLSDEGKKLLDSDIVKKAYLGE